MKTLRLPILQRLREYFSLIPGALGRPAEEDSLSWNLLLGGQSDRVQVAWKQTASNAYRLCFRHNFPGYARIELLLCHRMADGSVRMLSKVHGSGYANTLIADNRNTVRPTPGCNISIVTLCVRYSSYGVPHQLNIDTADNTQHLYRQGKPFTQGPKFSLALHSLPLTPISLAPISTLPGNQSPYSLAFAAC